LGVFRQVRAGEDGLDVGRHLRNLGPVPGGHEERPQLLEDRRIREWTRSQEGRIPSAVAGEQVAVAVRDDQEQNRTPLRGGSVPGLLQGRHPIELTDRQVFVRRAEEAVLVEDFLHVPVRGGLSVERTRGPQGGDQAYQCSSQQHGWTPRGAIPSGGLWPVLRSGERMPVSAYST